MAWTQSPCPKCGRLERHDSGMYLKLCAICLMRGADVLDQDPTYVESERRRLLEVEATLRRKRVRVKDE